jgi:hypothetical protein
VGPYGSRPVLLDALELPPRHALRVFGGRESEWNADHVTLKLLSNRKLQRLGLRWCE